MDVIIWLAKKGPNLQQNIISQISFVSVWGKYSRYLGYQLYEEENVNILKRKKIYIKIIKCLECTENDRLKTHYTPPDIIMWNGEMKGLKIEHQIITIVYALQMKYPIFGKSVAHYGLFVCISQLATESCLMAKLNINSL